MYVHITYSYVHMCVFDQAEKTTQQGHKAVGNRTSKTLEIIMLYHKIFKHI